VGNLECDTVIGANHKGAIVTMVERKSGFGVIFKVAHKTSDLVSRAIVEGLQPFVNRVKTLTCDKGKEFAAIIQIDQALSSTGYFARPSQVGSGAPTRTLMVCRVTMCLKRN